MYEGMINYFELLDTYLDGYKRIRKTTSLTPVKQEVVLLKISPVNGRNCCKAAHSMIADHSRVPANTLAVIRWGGAIPDSRLKALSAFTQKMVESRGWPSRVDAAEFRSANFTEHNMPEIILAISAKVISDFSYHLFHTEVDDALPHML